MALNTKTTYIQFFQKLRQLIKDKKFNWINNSYEKERVLIKFTFDDIISKKYKFTKGSIEKNKLILSTFGNANYEMNGTELDFVVSNKKFIDDIIITEEGDVIAIETAAKDGEDVNLSNNTEVDPIKHVLCIKERKYDSNPDDIVISENAYKITEDDFDYMKKYGTKEIEHNGYRIIIPRSFIVSKKVDEKNETWLDFHNENEVSVVNVITKQFFIFKTKLDLNFINY